MALRSAVSRRLARVIRFTTSTACANPSGGAGSRNCDPEERTQVFHRPACGSIRKSGREQNRHGNAARCWAVDSRAWIGFRLSEINKVTSMTLGQRLHWRAKLLCFIEFSSENPWVRRQEAGTLPACRRGKSSTCDEGCRSSPRHAGSVRTQGHFHCFMASQRYMKDSSENWGRRDQFAPRLDNGRIAGTMCEVVC